MIVQNKVTNYIFYAIGEIILVVVGILIALQVNNWNENRRVESVELHLLKEIKGTSSTTTITACPRHATPTCATAP